jgi:hypothetical protein
LIPRPRPRGDDIAGAGGCAADRVVVAAVQDVDAVLVSPLRERAALVGAERVPLDQVSHRVVQIDRARAREDVAGIGSNTADGVIVAQDLEAGAVRLAVGGVGSKDAVLHRVAAQVGQLEGDVVGEPQSLDRAV